MKGGWREKLSVLFCRYILDDFRGKRKLESDGFSREVHLFEAELQAGIYTEWNHILMNNKLFEDGSENLRRQIFLHEIGHSKSSSPLIVTASLSNLWIYIFGPPLGLLAATFLGSAGLLNLNILGLGTSTAKALIYTIIGLYFASILMSYLAETKADPFSLKHMDTEEFKQASQRRAKRNTVD